jgi:hypothetical protein
MLGVSLAGDHLRIIDEVVLGEKKHKRTQGRIKGACDLRPKRITNAGRSIFEPGKE